MREPEWAVVVPVKRLAVAKTRLRNTISGVSHERLVLALAQDTVRAVLLCPMVLEVLVVTDDPEASALLGALGARVLPDAPAAGLNAALAYGAVAVGRPRRWVAALAADLPALRPAELAGALREVAAGGLSGGAGRGFVADAAGTGTTLLAARPGVAIDPQFGPDSAARHAAAGARRLGGEWPSLRRDVDTAADLTEAARLGLGPYTAAVWREPVR
jgi:2-phospho-L-lactate guanylyltransferase